MIIKINNNNITIGTIVEWMIRPPITVRLTQFKHGVPHETGQISRSLSVFEVFFFLHQPLFLICAHVTKCFFFFFVVGFRCVTWIGFFRSSHLHNCFLQMAGQESATNIVFFFLRHLLCLFVCKKAAQSFLFFRKLGSLVHAIEHSFWWHPGGGTTDAVVTTSYPACVHWTMPCPL